MNLTKSITISAAIMAALTVSAVTPNIERDRRAEAEHWADSVYSTLTPRQRIGQLVVAGIDPSKGEASRAAVKAAVDAGCGGMLFSKSTLAQSAQMTNYGQALAKVPLLMTLDGEWGLPMRIAATPRFPENMALGAVQDYRLLYDYGREVARECRLMGINVNFAPVADVNSNPRNPVIGYRSFGEDPARVAKAVTAYSLGLEDGGVQAVAKHFPGHGDTETDSHKAIAIVNHSTATLDSTDLVPFREFIDGGGSGVMVGHLSVPALDKSGMPASLSHTVTTGLLRNQMDFEGIIYTDGLGMKGVQGHGIEPAVGALLAGVDVLLYPYDARSAINSVSKAVADGRIDTTLIADRCKRMLRYKYLLGAGLTTEKNYDELSQKVNSPEAEALIKKLAAASITVVRNKNNLLPFGKLDKLRISVVNIGAPADNDFMNTCRHYADIKSFFTSGGAFSEASLAKINDADVVVAAVYSDKADCRNALAQLARTSPSLVGVFMMNPYKMQKFSQSVASMNSVVLAYDNIPAERISAAEALFGGIAVSGKLPVNLRGIAPVGTGISYPKTRLGFSSPVAEDMASWLPDSINTIVKRAMRDGAFPGCQVLVARNGNIVFDKAYGRLSKGSETAVDASTIYDLASVSKAIGTLPGIMKAYDEGLISLDERLGSLIPEISDSAKREITVRELLYHETGMPASLNMFDTMIDTLSYTGKLITARPDRNHSIKIQRRAYGHNTARLRTDIASKTRSDRFPVESAKGIFTGKETYDTIMHRIYDIKLRPNKNYNYSCLNFCLLMDIEQRRTGRSHDEFMSAEIFGPLGAYRTGYRPATWTSTANIAPTEHDTFLRRQTLKGYVHDELANFSGGVQGNAGLFANADDIAKVCQMLLNGGTYGDARIISEKTAQLFTTDKSRSCRRGLGFDKPDTENPDYSPTCEEAPGTVFGHLGFTGTVFWVDPAKNLIFVFLTNRVNPTRDNAAFNRANIRPALFSSVLKSIE